MCLKGNARGHLSPDSYSYPASVCTYQHCPITGWHYRQCKGKHLRLFINASRVLSCFCVCQTSSRCNRMVSSTACRQTTRRPRLTLSCLRLGTSSTPGEAIQVSISILLTWQPQRSTVGATRQCRRCTAMRLLRCCLSKLDLPMPPLHILHIYLSMDCLRLKAPTWQGSNTRYQQHGMGH